MKIKTEWNVMLSDGKNCQVSAFTKGEARGVAKKILGIRSTNISKKIQLNFTI